MLKQFFILIFILPLFAIGQKQLSMEQYYYVQPKNFGFVVPKISYEAAGNWYAEARYNYEEMQTGSLHIGKKISFKKLSGLEITPLMGICFGALNGASVGSSIGFSVDRFSFYSEPQYVYSFKDSLASYFYSWSEILYGFSSFYGGVALQQTKTITQAHFFEPGIVAGFTLRNFDIPLYCFSLFNDKRNFVLGVNWKWKKQ